MKLLLVLAALSLAGCSATPTYVLGNQTNSAFHYTVGDKDSVGAKLKCPMYEPPEFSKMPRVPLKEYGALKAQDFEKRIDLLLGHIEELRNFIAAARKQQADAFSRYTESCQME